MKKSWVLLLVLIGFASYVSAKGNVTLNGGFSLSSMSTEAAKYAHASTGSKVGAGGNLSIDFLLPMSIPISLGIESGGDTAKVSAVANYSGNEEILFGFVIPLLARVAYHFDFYPKLDLYLVGKIGYAFGLLKGDYNGIGFGADVGVAYYFTPHFGLFAEGGFDRYSLSPTGDNPKMLFTRFLTFGFSTKF